jgi:aliphatic nitrilase
MAYNARLIVVRVVLGFCELDGGSMYAAQAIINSEGAIVLHRRKLKVCWMFVAPHLNTE